VGDIEWINDHQSSLQRIKNGLRWAREKLQLREDEIITVPHYLLGLRERVNYEDAYLFFRLYDPNPRSRLELALSNLVSQYLCQTELFLIRLFGWTDVNIQFETFASQLKNNLEFEAPELQERLSLYENEFAWPVWVWGII